MADRDARKVLIISCMAYIGLGVITSVFGPLLPELATRTGSDLAGVGLIFVVLFAGGLLAQLVAGPVSDRLGARPLFLFGLLLGGLGMLALSTSPSLLILVAVGFLAGIGQGSVDVSCNVMVARAYMGRNVAPLNWLHLFFGLGAVLGPALVSLCLRLFAVGQPALWISGAMFLVLLPFAWRLQALSAPAQTGHERIPAGQIYRSPLLWAFIVLFLLYVGIEAGVGGWTTVYLQRTTALVVERGALVTSAYWLALTAGRLLSALVGTRVSARSIMLLDLSVSLVAAGLLFLGLGRQALTIGAIVLLGFGFGSVYPTAMALVSAAFGGAGRAISAMTAAGSIGGMTLPWLLGVLITTLGPQSGAALVLVGCLAMLALYIVTAQAMERGKAKAAAGATLAKEHPPA
jgi:MFS transporter, FHS family, glucose/mannose:H+ symporter